MPEPIRVLFVCTHNSARSQIAHALLERDGAGRFEVYSAGTHPTGVHPSAVAVLADRGIDWRDARSTPVTEYLGQSFDVVVTVCDRAREACPVFPGARATVHWSLEDPAAVDGPGAEVAAAFDRTATEIEARLGPFIAAVSGRGESAPTSSS